MGTRSGKSRGLWLSLAFSCSILLFSMFSHINTGVRHVLPVYLGFSVAAAAGAVALLNEARRWRAAGWIGWTLLLTLAVNSALSHPDYLAYFNPLAGSHPERVLVDSDLDWGQDVKRLAQRLQSVGANQLAYSSCMLADSGAFGSLPVSPNDFLHPLPGWNAMRLTVLELMLADKEKKNPQLRFWPEDIKPDEKIGKGILLWYFPPGKAPSPLPGSLALNVSCLGK